MNEPNVALDAAYQPPMTNGEVVFEEPWQGRVFAMAVALEQAGVFAWSDFQRSLIEVIGEWDSAPAGAYEYYRHFTQALERLLLARGILPEAALGELARELATREHGHDH